MDPQSTRLILALAGFILAMMMLVLLTAFFRVTGLARNGLLEPEAVNGALRRALSEPRRYIVALGTWYLLTTVLSVSTLAQEASLIWPQMSPLRFHVVSALGLTLIWSFAGAVVKARASRDALDTMRVLGTMVQPLVWLLTPWSMLLVRSEQEDDTAWSAEAMPHLSTDEIRSLMHDDEDVNLEDDEKEMIRSIFGFHETTVKEIMIPRIDMISLDGSLSVTEAMTAVVQCRHSRIPLHDGSIDKVTGLLYAKDLLGLVEAGGNFDSTRAVSELARPAYFFPESKKLDDVLEEFRSNRIHMAVVIDEYGGTAGLVTLEDVLEEIVGEIEDEFDEQEKLFDWQDERNLQVEPKIDLEDLQEVLGVELPVDEGSETLAGLIYEAAGKVPEKGDKVEIAGLSVTVLNVEDQRILKVAIQSVDPLPGSRRAQEGSVE
jgi:CBS domain containing-hemolysin-like protein